MKPDLYLKTVFTVIALCLMVIAVKFVPLISAAKAGESTHCTGDITANADKLGNINNPHGYEIDINCD